MVLFGALLSVLVLLFTAGPAGATAADGQSVHGHAGARPAHRQVVKRSAAHPAGKSKASRAVQQQRTTATARAQPADRRGQSTAAHGQHTATGQAAGNQGLTAAAPSATQRAIQQAAQAAAQLAAQAAAQLAAQAAAQLAAQAAAEQAAQQAGRQAQAGQPSTGQPASNQQSGNQPVAIQPVDQVSARAPSTSSRPSRQAQHGTATSHPGTKSAPESLPHRMISAPVVPIIALAIATLSVGSGPALIVLIVIAGAGLLLVAAGTRRSALHR